MPERGALPGRREES